MVNQHYITRKRTKLDGIDGAVNIPYGTSVEVVDECLVYQGKRICFVTSQNAFDYFSCNDDGNGLMRGKMVQAIQDILGKRDKDYQKRWDKIWNDPKCCPFKIAWFEDHWLWNFDFYNAKIEDLRYIANLIGAKEVA